MSDPGPRPDDLASADDELAHMERMRTLRTAADEKLARLNTLFTQARAALADEAERALEPHVQHLYEVMTPILEEFAGKSQELLRDYRQGVAEAREAQEVAGRELRLIHERRSTAIHQQHEHCPVCMSCMTNPDKCMRCNGEPATARRKPTTRDRVQS